MRGDERVQDEMFSSVRLEQRVPQDHPLREIRKLCDTVLGSLSAEFDALYSVSGRPSIAPEYMLRALLLQAFYSVRSERLLVEEIDYNLLFRWFVGLGMDDAVWNHAVFSKNRDRLLNSTVAQSFFAAVNEQAKKFMSDDHFTVDGTLIQAWASQKSFRRKDGSDDDGTNFHGDKRSNDTHESTTDPDARLYKKSYGKESKLAYLGHALVENRNGLIAAAAVTQAGGHGERKAALEMLQHNSGRGQGIRRAGFRNGCAPVACNRSCDKERQGTAQQHRSQDDAALRLCHQRKPALAGGENIRLAQANRAAAAGEVARTGQSGLAVRIQLRGAQPDAATQADRARPQAAVRLKKDRSAKTALHNPPKSASTLAKHTFQTKTSPEQTQKPKDHAPLRAFSTSS
jgi:transposase